MWTNVGLDRGAWQRASMVTALVGSLAIAACGGGGVDRSSADDGPVVTLAKPQSVVSLEPRTINVSGKAYAGPKVYATISSVDLRADNPRVHREIGSGYEWMLLHFTATNDSAAGMAILYEFDQRLVLPDGSAVSTSSSSCGNAQLHPGPYSTARDGVACFEVPIPVGGTYTYDISDSDSPGFTFTIN